MNPELEAYYNYLKGAGADVPESLKDFQYNLQDEVSAKSYYDYLKKNEFDTPETFQDFAYTLGVKKKATPLAPGVSGPEQPQNGGLPSFEDITAPPVKNPQELISPIPQELTTPTEGGPPPTVLPQENDEELTMLQRLQKNNTEQLRKMVPKGTAALDLPELVAGGTVNTIITNSIKGVGAVDEVLWNNIYKLLGKEPDYESAATRAGKSVEEFYTPKVSKETQESFAGQVAQGLGTAIGMMATGKPNVASPFAKAPTVLQSLKNTVTSPAAVLGGAMTAIPEYEAAKAAGVPNDELFGVLAKNYLVGQTEAIPIAHTFERLNKITGGSALNKLKQIGVASGIGGFEEATQEAVQTYLTNQIAKGEYDPDRDPLWQVLESATVGGVVGMILPGIGRAITNAPQEVKDKIAPKIEQLQALEQKALSGEEIKINAPEGPLGKQQENETKGAPKEQPTPIPQEESTPASKETKENPANVNPAGGEEATVTQQISDEKVDQKAGEIIPRQMSETATAAIEPAVTPIKDDLVKAGKIKVDDAGNVTEVKQNSGYPSKLYEDLKSITGDGNIALNEYLKIKQDDGDFKKRHGDWENHIMKEFGRSGQEYEILRRKKPFKNEEDAYASVREENGKLKITFNEQKVRRDIKDFDKVKRGYQNRVVKKEDGTPAEVKAYENEYAATITKLRDLKLHLIHLALIQKMKGEVTLDDKMNSLKEIARLNKIDLAKDYYGEPMMFMHSGQEGITKFKKPGESGYVASDAMTGGAGIYFSRSPKGAKMYSEFGEKGPGKGKDVYYVFLKTKNPYYVNDPQAQAKVKLGSSETISKKDETALKEAGYDSVIWDTDTTAKREVVVFEPDQIEIIGTFKEGFRKKHESAAGEQSAEIVSTENDQSNGKNQRGQGRQEELLTEQANGEEETTTSSKPMIEDGVTETSSSPAPSLDGITPVMQRLYDTIKERMGDKVASIDKVALQARKFADMAQHEEIKIEDFAIAIDATLESSEIERNRVSPRGLQDSITSKEINGRLEYFEQAGLDSPAQKKYIALHERVKDLQPSAKQYLASSTGLDALEENDFDGADRVLQEINDIMDIYDQTKDNKSLEKMKSSKDLVIIGSAKQFLDGSPDMVALFKKDHPNIKRPRPLTNEQLENAIKEGEESLNRYRDQAGKASKKKRSAMDEVIADVQAVVDEHKADLDKSSENGNIGVKQTESTTQSIESKGTNGGLPRSTKKSKAKQQKKEEPRSQPQIGDRIDYYDHTGVDRTGIVKEIEDNGHVIVTSKDYHHTGEEETINPKKIISLRSTRKDNSEPVGSGYSGEQSQTGKYYEPPVGSPKKQRGGRVNVSPIYGGVVKKISEIVLNLAKIIPSQVYQTKRPSSRRSLGSYNPRNAAVAIKYQGDMDTLAHELGHSLDDSFDILGKMTVAAKKELRKLSRWGSNPPRWHPNPKTYRLGEGVAEYIRAWLVNPKKAENRYPETTTIFKQALPQGTIDGIRKFGDDIRSFAGLSAHDKIMSNVEFDPTKQKGGFWSRLFPKSINSEAFELTWLDRLSSKFLNSMLPYEKSVRFLMDQQGINELDPSKDPTILARLLPGFNERMSQIFENGLVDFKSPVKQKGNGFDINYLTDNGERMNFEWLIKPLDTTDEASIIKSQQEVISYMIAERTFELSNKLDRKDFLTGIGAGIFMDNDVAKQRLIDFSTEPQAKKDQIQEAARRYRVYADSVLQQAVDSGRMSQDTLDLIRLNNMEYVALQRIFEIAPGEEVVNFSSTKSRALGGVADIIKSIKGSTRTIKNPYQSLIENTIKTIREADRNNVMLAFRELFLVNRGMNQGTPTSLGSVARLAGAGDKNTVVIFVDGKKEHWQLDDDVYEAVKGITDASYKIPGFITALPRLLRWTVVNFPTFAVRNRIRDIGNRLIISDTKPNNGWDIYKSKELRDQTAKAFSLFGGGQGGYYLMNDDFYKQMMNKAAQDLSKNKKFILTIPSRLVSKFGSGYNALISSGEAATRKEEYRSAYKDGKSKGMDDYNASLYAAYKSRDLLDFAVAGEYIRLINQILPFTNAAIQGIRKTIKSAKSDPLGFSLRFTLYAIIPALINRLLIHLFDDDEEYSQLPNYQRDLFYNIPVGKDLWLSIPKPFELGVFASSAERMIDKMWLGDDKAFDGYGGSVARTTIPVDDAALAGGYRPLVEVLANYDFFREKHIIPPNEEGMDLELRGTETASRLGKGLQETVGVDARLIDHLLKSGGGYFGDFAVITSDLGRDDTRNPMDLTTTGLFRHDPVYGSKSVQEMMGYVEKYGIPSNNKLIKAFNQLLSDYFSQTDPEMRDKAGDTVRDFAKNANILFGDPLYKELIYLKDEKKDIKRELQKP